MKLFLEKAAKNDQSAFEFFRIWYNEIFLFIKILLSHIIKQIRIICFKLIYLFEIYKIAVYKQLLLAFKFKINSISKIQTKQRNLALRSYADIYFSYIWFVLNNNIVFIRKILFKGLRTFQFLI